MLQELDQDDCAYFRHRRSRPVGNPHARRKPTSITSRAFTTQRRHLSGRARARFRVTDSPIPTLPETLGDPRQLSQQQITLEFQKLINRASKDFDPDLTWEFYEALEASPTQHQKLTLADQLLHAGEQFYGTENEAKGRRSQLWAERASEVLEGLGPETVRWGNWINQLHARATAALGDFDKAVSYASKVSSRAGQNDSSNAWAKILSSVSHRQGAVAALDFIVANWALLKNLFSDKGSPLRQTADALVRRIEDPAQVMARRRDHVTHEERRIAGCVLIDVFAYIDARQGLAVYEELKRQAVTIPLGHKLALVRRLADTRAFGPAELLFNSIEDKEPRRDILSTGLYLQSRQALRESASHWYDELEAEGLAQPHDITNHLFAYARAGDVDGVLHQFNKHFPLGPDNKRLNSPQVPHYSPVILALSKRGLSEEIAKWLQDLSDNGLKPDVYTYTLVLQALALGDDLQGALAVLKNMQSEGIQPNVVAYTIVITLLAHRKDAFGAEAVFRRALQDDIVPDTKMMSALMNAHVEAGSWKGVIRVYDFLNSKRIRSRVRMSIDVYNTLLKAYVLAGAPFSVVSKVFQTLEDSKVKPDNRTFCLLIQSACDAGKIELASDLFWRMDALASARKERDLSVNIFALTILMAAYLRIGKKVKAKAVFDEMQSRGIDPTSVTFATILRAYGNERTVESMQIAEHFITELLAAPPEEQSWNIPRYGRVPAIQQIYSPVMQAYAKQAKLDDVERMFESMLKKGGAPSLGTLTMLLDACRRTFNVKGVLEVWPQILQLGLRYLNSLPADIKGEHRGFSLGSNILSAPLSIYIDALSAAGMHGEVAETWHEMRRLGFTYDSHNYNNLVVALVRAGQVERAFEVVDRVLLPNHNRAKHFVPTRNKSPASPLLFETAPETLNAQTEESEGQVDQVDSAESTAPINDQEDQEQPSESTATAPAEVSEDNAESEEDQTHDIPGRKIRHHSKDRRKAMKEAHKNLKYEDLFDDDFGEHDLARPLHVLHQLAPSWGLWRPHTTVLTILLQAHAQLERGEIIYPIPAPDAEPMEPLENEAQHARAILVNIYKEYPIATQVVLKHQSLEKRRLGWEDYSRIYEG